MRRLVFAVLSAATALTAAGSTSAHAQEYPYCLQGGDWGYPGKCDFSTYQQCQASASGTNASCGANPRYAAGPGRGYRRPY